MTADRTPSAVQAAENMVIDMERFVAFAEGGGDWDFDQFEAVSLADAALERLRLEAVMAGPPNCDLAILRRVLEEARDVAAQRRPAVP